jgi:polygalacturonase
MIPLRRTFLIAAALFAVRAATAAGNEPPDVSPAQPVIPDRIFNLTDFGAAGDDGATDSTEAFKHAIAAVAQAGGGTLVVPAAKGAYFTGPIDLCSHINLRLDAGATILFSPQFDLYLDKSPRGSRPLIQIKGQHDVLISGAGTIDGNGLAWWPEARRYKAMANARHAAGNTSPRPIMLWFSHSQRTRVEGITLTDAPVLNIRQDDCADVTVVGVNIVNPADSPNTDGVDPKNCQRVLIAHCRIDTGDDCIALGGSGGATEEDVLVTDCTFLHGHGCSVGSGTASGLRNLIVRRCTFDGTETGVRLKSARGRGGLVENVVYEDLTMKNVGVAISISNFYDNTALDLSLSRAAVPPAGLSAADTPHWRNVTIRNITATACQLRAGMMAGLPEAPAEGITLENVSIEAPAGLYIADTKDIVLRHVRIAAAKGPDVIADPSVTGLTRTD